MTQVIQHTHEDDYVECLRELRYFVNVHLPKLYIGFVDTSGEARLLQIILVRVDTDNSICAALLHFNRIKPPIAADIEYGFAGKIRWDRVFEGIEFDARIVPEKMIRRRFHTL